MHVPTLLAALGLALLTSCSGSKATSQVAPAEATQTPAPPADAARAMGVDPDDRATPEERADRQTVYLTERLGLREDQVAPVRAIALEYTGRQAALRKESRGDRRAMMQGMRALMEEQDAAYEGVLDETQYAELQEVKAEVREKMRGRLQERRERRQRD